MAGDSATIPPSDTNTPPVWCVAEPPVSIVHTGQISDWFQWLAAAQSVGTLSLYRTAGARARGNEHSDRIVPAPGIARAARERGIIARRKQLPGALARIMRQIGECYSQIDPAHPVARRFISG